MKPGLPLKARRTVMMLGLLCGAASLPGQQAETLAPSPASPQSVSSRTVTLDVQAEQKGGAAISGLGQGDFTVLDNKTTQTLTSFREVGAGAAPARVLIAVDAVNIGFTRLAYARDQLQKFLSANEGRLAAPTTLAVVTDTGTSVQPSATTDGNALSEAVKNDQIGLRILRRSSGFYGASDRIQLSLTALRQLIAQEAALPGRKLLVWLSPGWPLLSGPRVDLGDKTRQAIFNDIVSLSNQMRAAQITLYSVNPLGAGESVRRASYYQSFLKGISKPNQVDLADLSLQVLATQTGGLVLEQSNDLVSELQRCVGDTREYYELTFAPVPGEPNEYHGLQVKLDKPGVEARTRDGYYSAP